MFEKPSENSEKLTMSAADQMSRMLSEVAGLAGSVKERIRRAARRLGWKPSRTKSLWYGEARRIDAEEYLAARAYLDARAKQDAQNELSKFRSLEARIARLEANSIQVEN